MSFNLTCRRYSCPWKLLPEGGPAPSLHACHGYFSLTVSLLNGSWDRIVAAAELLNYLFAEWLYNLVYFYKYSNWKNNKLLHNHEMYPIPTWKYFRITISWAVLPVVISSYFFMFLFFLIIMYWYWISRFIKYLTI